MFRYFFLQSRHLYGFGSPWPVSSISRNAFDDDMSCRASGGIRMWPKLLILLSPMVVESYFCSVILEMSGLQTSAYVDR